MIRQIISEKLLPAVTKTQSAGILRLILKLLFILSLAGLCLGSAAWILTNLPPRQQVINNGVPLEVYTQLVRSGAVTEAALVHFFREVG